MTRARADALAQEVVFVSLPRRLFAPGESVVGAEQLDETLRRAAWDPDSRK